MSLKAGTTSYIAQIFIQDSSSTTGAGLAALTSGSTGLTAYYHRDTDTTATVISLTTMTLGTFTSSGFLKIDDTNMPGWYQLCIPNAAIAAGAKSCAIHLKGVTNMAPLPLEIELTGWDNQSATDGGLSKLTSLTFTGANKVDASVRDWVGDTIPARSVTGVPKVDVQDWTGTAVATPATAGIPEVNVKNINNVSTTAVTTVKAVQGLTTADTIATYTGNTPQTGDNFVRIGAAGAGLTALGDTRIANLDATVSSRTKPADTQAAVTTVTNLTNAPTAGDLTATMKASVATAVWTDLLASADFSTVSSVGALLKTDVDSDLAAISTALNSVLSLLSDPRTEPGQGAPAVNPSAMAKLDYLYKSWRNLKTNDGTTTLLYANNGTTVDQKQTTSQAAGTVTKAKWVTGP